MPPDLWRCLFMLPLFPGIVMDSGPAPPAPVIAIYRTSCLKCHDTDGKGEIVRDVMPKVPDFTDAAWQATRSDPELARSVLEGKGKSMPPMRGKLGSVDVEEMVALVRSFRGGQRVVEEEVSASDPPAPAPALLIGPGPSTTAPPRPATTDPAIHQGNRIFQRSCAVCHGGDGRGGEMQASLPGIPDFTAGVWQATRTDAQLVVSVLDGKGTGMPPFRDKLSREQARELVALIRSLGPSPSRARRMPPEDFEVHFQQLLAEFEDLRRRSRAISSDAPSRPTETSPPPSTPQARRTAPQSSGDGRRDAGG